MDKRLNKVDDLMKKEYGEKVTLLEHYGPVQMCVFGLTYRYLPTNERIMFECERGAITVKLIGLEGKVYYPSEYFEKSRYTHWEDQDEDLLELVCSIRELIELMK